MKKIVSLAIACMLVLSCFAINAFAAETFVFTASELDNDVFGLTLNTAQVLKTGKFVLSFDSSKVALLNSDGSEVTATAASAAFTVDELADNIASLNSGIKYDATNCDLAYTFQLADASGDGVTGDLVTIYFKKVGTIAANDTPIWVINSTSPNYAKTGSGWKAELTFNGGLGFNQTKTAGNAAYKATDGSAVASFVFDNIVDEEKEEIVLGDAADVLTSADVVGYDKDAANADGLEGKGVLTFAGRIKANELDQPYGVIVNGRKFFGAPRTHKDVPAEFDWEDGAFSIVLKNITNETSKDNAGDKDYQYFVGDKLTDVATITVE